MRTFWAEISEPGNLDIWELPVEREKSRNSQISKNKDSQGIHYVVAAQIILSNPFGISNSGNLTSSKDVAC